MRKIGFWLVFLLLCGGCNKAPRTVVSFHVDGAWREAKVTLTTPDSVYCLTLDSTRSAMLVLPSEVKGGYGSLNYGRLCVPVYIEAGKDFDLALQFEERYAVPYFTGEGARKNEYLNQDWVRKFKPDFRVDEASFLQILQEQEQRQSRFLDSMLFEESFRTLESRRLHYAVYAFLPLYPSYHTYYVQDNGYKPSSAFYEKVKTEIREESELMSLPEYKAAWIGKITALAEQGKPGYEVGQCLETQLKCIEETVTEPLLKEFLTDHFMTGYVKNYGMAGFKDIETVYRNKVNHPEKRKAFSELCGEWSKLETGCISPEFRYADLNGKMVALSDFAGKYVFIQIWASWCEPCREELPHWKELAWQFEGTDICFVSISCNWDKAAWRRTVKEEQLPGIQLYADRDSGFLKAYMVRNIPRFILIDREGRIIDSGMSRPSASRTLKILYTLVGIEDLP